MLKFYFHTLLLLILGPMLAFAQESTLPTKLVRDGQIRLYIYHTDTFADLTYLDANGQWLPKVYDEINSLLRSYTDDKIHPIDKRLIELADHLQDHFAVDVIEVISGFRSPDYNRELKESGHNVANESFHTKGMAMDIHIDEVNETQVRDYLQALGLGGVGYYGTKLMVHMDFGPVRTWQDDNFRENVTVGIFNKETPMRIETDRFYYHEDQGVRIRSLNSQYGHPLALSVQHFYRGKWQDVQCPAGEDDCLMQMITLPANVSQGLSLKHLLRFNGNRFGKYRLKFAKGDFWQNSNEFYVKR